MHGRAARAGRAWGGAAGLAFALTLGTACSGPGAITGCDEVDGVTPVCGFTNPEDLALAPGGAWLLVSQFRASDTEAGSLVAWRLSDGARVTLHPTDGPSPPLAPAGADTCPGAPDATVFAPHGIDVANEPYAPPMLLVVNHGGRESVEMFEIGIAGGAPALWWRGCVPLPEGAWGNDVAALPGGGLVVTNMMPPPQQGVGALGTFARMALGMETGGVLEWMPSDADGGAGGWRELPDARGSGPNGVAVSPDGSEVYFGEWAGRRLVRVRREGDPDRHSVELPNRPDNLTWTRDGRLLVTGQEGGAGDVLGCASIEGGTCAVPFSVLAVDPVTLDARVLLRSPARAMGAGSVALLVGDQLYLGTFAGDRIARAPMPAP